MNLIVDIGNSRCKMALCSAQNEVLELSVSEDFSAHTLQEWTTRHQIKKAIFCSTRGEQTSIVNEIQKLVGQCLRLSSETPKPIKNRYSTPQTLGMDRLAAAIGAEAAYGAGNKLIIDLGTAITIDFVSSKGAFEGGYISLGLGARFRALNEFTASLPLFQPQNTTFELPRTTKDAITQGVMLSILHELNGHIEFFLEKYGEINVIFTGGDAKYFANQIKNAIFAKGDLVILGLNRILEYNVNIQI